MSPIPITVLLALGSAVSAVSAADVEAGREKAAACAGCHGADGNSRLPAWPRLAGQQATYLVKQLEDFQRSGRTDPMMTGLARGLSADDRANLAAWFSSQTPTPAPAAGNVELGRTLYHSGLIRSGIPPCDVCHGPDGTGSAGFGGGGFPAVGGQHADYTAKQLRDFAAGRRVNDPGGMMGHIAAKLDETEILSLAAYLQSMRPPARETP